MCVFVFQNRSLNKSTESVKCISLDSESDNKDQNHLQSEISKKDVYIGSELEDNVKELIEENESLRKGMHEILDSVHNQDGNVKILFRILDRNLFSKIFAH